MVASSLSRVVFLSNLVFAVLLSSIQPPKLKKRNNMKQHGYISCDG